MSLETREDLQRNFLIGNCANRPRAWHNDPALRARLGLEDNHYDEPIPYSEVVRRLFNWEPVAVPKANIIPCDKKDANWFMERDVLDEDGYPVRDSAGNIVKEEVPVKVSISETELGIIRSDTQENMATHGAGYKIHGYEKFLLQLQSNIIGDSLTILGAGLPKQGAQAYVQCALPDVFQDDKTGVGFLPYILASTSIDGSLATTYGVGSLLVVCDNTRNMALGEQKKSGRLYKVKHTSKSLEANRIQDVRDALGLIYETADGLMAEFQTLASIPVTKTQWSKVRDTLLPMPEDIENAAKRTITYVENRRDELDMVYWDRNETTRGMMANQQGTALGVVQAVNTWATHVKPVKGNRFEGNIDRMIAGTFDEVDQKTVSVLADVLEKPELISV